MKISVDNLYVGCLCSAKPIIRIAGKTTSIKYALHECNDPLIIQMERDPNTNKLMANVHGLNQKYALCPTSFRRETFFVDKDAIKNFRDYFYAVKFPEYVDSSKVEELGERFVELNRVKTGLGLSNEWLQLVTQAQAVNIIRH